MRDSFFINCPVFFSIVLYVLKRKNHFFRPPDARPRRRMGGFGGTGGGKE